MEGKEEGGHHGFFKDRIIDSLRRQPQILADTFPHAGSTQPYSPPSRGPVRITDSIQDTHQQQQYIHPIVRPHLIGSQRNVSDDNAVHESSTFSVPGRLHNMRTKQPSMLPYRKEKLGPRTRLHCKGSSIFLQTQIGKMAHCGYGKREVAKRKSEG
ncbi:hypothetical protein PVL29_018386 [Vitis rotundifolia]|uniref:Uncharacterized protein n=1 Tax=Vitis rotundifolia TaxID=103349 RepID=A0AA38Z4W8_VITRO|nr:hypothetical protein PVL29_018386 [Vitis rotundifolia]